MCDLDYASLGDHIDFSSSQEPNSLSWRPLTLQRYSPTHLSCHARGHDATNLTWLLHRLLALRMMLPSSIQVKIDVLMIELDNHQPDKNWKIRKLLKNLGYYECIQLHVTRSAVFVPAKSHFEDKCKALELLH